MKKAIVTVYSLLHFIVDLSCALLISMLTVQKAGTTSLFTAVVTYNFFAFAVQLPIGIIGDKINKNALLSAVGCALAALAYAFYRVPMAACITAGLGNAMFHIGGGIDVLNISEHKAAPSGIFVSTGALGIFLGAKAAVSGFTRYFLAVPLLLCATTVLILLYTKIKGSVTNSAFVLTSPKNCGLAAAVCLVMTVGIRSYVGMILAFDWKQNTLLAVLAISAVIGGKMLGGIIGDTIGFTRTALLSLSVAAVCFLFAFDVPALGIAAILCFNMTMPITLTALSHLFDGAKGFAFGLLTLALFVGALPTFYGYTALFSPRGLAAVTAVSAVILYGGIRCYEKSNGVIQ